MIRQDRPYKLPVPTGPAALHPAVRAGAILLVGVELALWLSRLGGAPLRGDAIAAFGLSLAWTAEPYRLASHVFLHGDPGHLVINLIPILLLGDAISLRWGVPALAGLTAAAALGGAAGFLVFGTSPAMIGASGVAFGLAAAACLFWRELGLVHRVVAALMAASIPPAIFMFPGLAWEAHLAAIATTLGCAALLSRFKAARGD